MPGIFGIVQSQQPDSHAHLTGPLRRMLSLVQREPWHQMVVSEMPEDNAVFGSVYLPAAILDNCESLDSTPRFYQDQEYCLGFHGEIVEPEVLARQVGLSFPKSPLSQILLKAYKRNGVHALAGLNGLYTIFIWDRKQSRLLLVNDRYGQQKLYIWQPRADLFLFASEYKAFTDYPGFHSTIDPQALADFLTLGYILDDRTLFSDVKLLPPASILKIENGKVDRSTYWDYEFDDGGSPKKSEREYLAEFSIHVENAVRRRIKPAACLLLTGGLDSRLLAGFYRKLQPDQPIQSLTLGQPLAMDARSAEKIACRLGFDHTLLPIPPTYMTDLLEECVWLTEANMNAYAGWILLANPFFRQNHIQYALTGVGGENISGRLLLFKSLQPDPALAFQAYFQRSDLEMVRKLLRPPFGDQLTEEVKGSFWRTYHQVNASHPLNRLDAVGFIQDIRRSATSIDVFADVAHPLDPLMDNDLMDFALLIPPELRARGYLLRKLMDLHLGEIARIGDFPRRGPVFKPVTEQHYHRLFQIYQGFQRRLRRFKAGTTNTGGDHTENYILPNTWLRTASKDAVLQIMAQVEYLDDFFDIEAVDSLIEDHMAGRRSEYAFIGALMTFITWRKLFT